MATSKEIVLQHLHELCSNCNGTDDVCLVCAGTGFMSKTIKELRESVPNQINRELVSAYLKYFMENGFASRKLIRRKGCTQIYAYEITELGIRWLFRPKQIIIIEDGD